jgi:membrane protein YdbS with pleckstrin-like domain
MENLVYKATFNRAVKTYIVWVGAIILFITLAGIPLAILWLLGPGWIIARRYYNSLECELTDSKLKFKKGVLVNVEKTIPLENIQDLTYIEGPILRAFKLSILKVETAGNSGSSSADMRLIGINEAQEFRNKVLEQRDLLKAVHHPSFSENSSTEVLSEIRDAVLEIRDLLKSK